METLLITGGAGFIGSHFIKHMLGKYPHYRIINLDKLTYAADLDNLKGVQDHSGYTFIRGDITSKDLVDYIFHAFDVKGVIHFAAESHVDNSIRNPQVFVQTNVLGTMTLLDAAKNYWMKGYNLYKTGYGYCKFYNVSTDEVYGSLPAAGCFTEESPYSPNSPYSATKAGGDMLARSYYCTYGLNVITSNCSNNFGPCQHDEKFIPTIIRKALQLESIPVYGDGSNIRDWLYVEDHCRAIDLIFHKGQSGQSYNIGGGVELENLQLARMVCTILDKLAPGVKETGGVDSFQELIRFVTDRQGHDKRYAIDSTKLRTKLGWVIEQPFNKSIALTVRWYINKYKPRNYSSKTEDFNCQNTRENLIS